MRTAPFPSSGPLTALLATTFGMFACSDPPDGPDSAGPDDPAAVSDNAWSQPDLAQAKIAQTQVIDAAWIPGSTKVAAAIAGTGDGCQLELIDITSRTIQLFNHYSRCTTPIAVAPDGRFLYYVPPDCNSQQPTVHRVNVADGEAVDPIPVQGHTCEIGSLAISPDGRWLAFTIWEPGFYLHDLTSGQDTVIVVSDSRGLQGSVFFSPDGGELLSVEYQPGASSHRLRRLAIATGVSELVTDRLYLPPFAWTQVGIQYIQYVGGRIGVILTNAETGQRLGTYGNHQSLSWSADGLHVAGATGWCFGYDCRRRRWEVVVADWRTRKALVIAREDCDALPIAFPGAVSPDGAIIVYGVCSGTYIWNRE